MRTAAVRAVKCCPKKKKTTGQRVKGDHCSLPFSGPQACCSVQLGSSSWAWSRRMSFLLACGGRFTNNQINRNCIILFYGNPFGTEGEDPLPFSKRLSCFLAPVLEEKDSFINSARNYSQTEKQSIHVTWICISGSSHFPKDTHKPMPANKGQHSRLACLPCSRAHSPQLRSEPPAKESPREEKTEQKFVPKTYIWPLQDLLKHFAV